MSFDKEKFKEECNRRRDANLGIGGKTFDIKDDIKGLGGIWDGMKKEWLMPDEASLNAVKGLLGYPGVKTEGESPRLEVPKQPDITDQTPF